MKSGTKVALLKCYGLMHDGTLKVLAFYCTDRSENPNLDERVLVIRIPLNFCKQRAWIQSRQLQRHFIQF